MLWPTFSVFACFIAHALAQASPTQIGTAGEVTSAPVPTVSLYLPMGFEGSLEASVVGAATNQTTYALSCARNESRTSPCLYSPAITLTEGESTIIWTNTFDDSDTMVTANPVTVQCELVGAHIYETPLHGATSAVCTASSAIPGLGMAGSTSTLASSQIVYYAVPITAGAEKLAAASTLTAAPLTSTSRAGAFAAVTPCAGLRLGGMLGVAVLGLV